MQVAVGGGGPGGWEGTLVWLGCRAGADTDLWCLSAGGAAGGGIFLSTLTGGAGGWWWPLSDVAGERGLLLGFWAECTCPCGAVCTGLGGGGGGGGDSPFIF